MTGKILCILLTGGNLAWVGASSSVVTLVAIAVERYYAVIYPHGNKGKLTIRKLKVCLLKFEEKFTITVRSVLFSYLNQYLYRSI